MSSDVSSDISDDDDENKLVRKSQKLFNKLASKGWSTCSDGFEKESRLPSGKRSSPSDTKNILRTIQRKKGIKKVYHKYSVISDDQLHQFLKVNIDVDPSFTSSGISKYHYPPTVVRYEIEKDYKKQGLPKVEKSKQWTLTKFEDSFSTSPALSKPSLNVIQKKSPLADGPINIDIRIDSSLSNEENTIDIGSFGTNSLKNKQSEEIVISSPSPQSSQRKLDQSTEQDQSNALLATPKCSFVWKYQNSVNKYKIERLLGDSSDNFKSVVLQKGSDWLKSIEWPNNVSTHLSNCANHSEEKAYCPKAPKFIPGGLAEQAAKLEKKVRHKRLIWSHQKKEKPNGCLEKCLTVRVGPFIIMNGMMLSKCLVLNKSTAVAKSNNVKLNASPDDTLVAEDDIRQVSGHESATSYIPTNTTELSNGKLNANTCDAKQDSKSVYEFTACGNSADIVPLNNDVKTDLVLSEEHHFLLLKPSIATDFKFAVGSIIRLYPPWQSLNVPNLPHPVILCPYYIDVQDICKLPENSVKCAMNEDIIFQNYENRKHSHVDETVASQKDWTKQRRPSAAKNKIKDITFFFERSQSDNLTCKTSSSIINNCDNDSCQSSQSNVQENILSSRSWNVPRLESFSVYATFPLCVRVQRIWQYSSSNFLSNWKFSSNISTYTNNARFSLLVQDENSRFFVLHLLNIRSMLKGSWKDLLRDGEGKCFCFHAVKITQILQPSRYSALFSILRNIEEKQQPETQQDCVPYQPFCYQLAVNCERSSVVHLSSSTYPPYDSYEISSLNKVIETDATMRRFSCYAKILCEFNNIVYVTDESLQKKQMSYPYIKVSFWSCKAKPPIRPGSNVLVTEAVVQKDSLFVDKYSTVTPLSKTEKGIINKPVSLEMVNDISSLSQSNFLWKNFQYSSKEGDLVTLKGIIQSVDEDSAISWLECNVCGKENLYQDADSRIWCSVCGTVAGNPKLNMKMNVCVRVIDMLEASIVLELSCTTTKRILEIPDHFCQPKCNIQDVLHKKIGPLVCFVRSRQSVSNQAKFELQEILIS